MLISPLNAHAETKAGQWRFQQGCTEICLSKSPSVPGPIPKSDSFSYHRLPDIGPSSYEMIDVTASGLFIKYKTYQTTHQRVSTFENHKKCIF